MRSLRSLFSHDFPLHIPQDETHFNPCLRQEQIDVEHHLFSALHLHLTHWGRYDGEGSRFIMIGAREFSSSFQPHSNGS